MLKCFNFLKKISSWKAATAVCELLSHTAGSMCGVWRVQRPEPDMRIRSGVKGVRRHYFACTDAGRSHNSIHYLVNFIIEPYRSTYLVLLVLVLVYSFFNLPWSFLDGRMTYAYKSIKKTLEKKAFDHGPYLQSGQNPMRSYPGQGVIPYSIDFVRVHKCFFCWPRVSWDILHSPLNSR